VSGDECISTNAFGVAFGALMAVAGAVKAHRTKQRIYHLSTVAGLSVMLIFALAFLGQFILAFVLVIVLGMFSYAMLPRVLKAREKEQTKKLQETEVSSPLTVRDLFTDALWLKLIARWGLWKSLGLIYLAFLAGIAGVLWVIGQFYTLITLTFIIVYAFTFSSLYIILLYRQLRKVTNLPKRQLE
jgi:membrane protein implicated in regulation of membrane protease activity